MVTEISIINTVDMFKRIAHEIIDSQDMLTIIDKKIGDGDHGIGMSEGFNEVLNILAENHEYETINQVFQTVGTALLDTMGGASGVLFGTVFISGLTGAKIYTTATTETFADFFEKSLNTLKDRGKAKVGDKTMVDALEPAVLSLIGSRENNIPLSEALEKAEKKAFEGKEYTKKCIAKFGRAKSYGEKALGFEDAGAVSVWIIFRSMSKWINESTGA